MSRRSYLPHALPDEKIILLVRRHPFVLFGRMLLWIVIGLVPAALALMVPGDFQGIMENAVGFPLAVLGLSTLYLFLWVFLLNSFVDYFLDVWIVTNERIINIEQRQLFSRISAEQKLSRIQDVTAEINGFWPTFLRYGEVHVQTAGTEDRFNFHQVPQPNDIARKITSLAEMKRRYDQVRDELDRAET
ncbi:MAG: PH domain-containing protein [Patescibacteria group bacterium]|nr:PH domain-containing protein [Patescibacteria group bacterium]